VLRVRHREQVVQAARVAPELREHAVDCAPQRELVKVVLVDVQPLDDARLVIRDHERGNDAGG
jgi:hypothetical protein